MVIYQATKWTKITWNKSKNINRKDRFFFMYFNVSWATSKDSAKVGQVGMGKDG